MKLKKFLDDCGITPAQVSTFYKGVRAFYQKAVEDALANLPVKDGLLRNATLVDFTFIETAQFVEVEYFVQRYAVLQQIIFCKNIIPYTHAFMQV